MTKIIDGKNAVLGRLASYVAKESLKGDEIVIVNCDEIIITGNRKDIKSKFEKSRTKVGSGHKGPKVSRTDWKIVKRAIRGMISNHRKGRGKEAFQRIKCYAGVPKEFEDSKKIVSGKERTTKFVNVKNILK